MTNHEVVRSESLAFLDMLSVYFELLVASLMVLYRLTVFVLEQSWTLWFSTK